MRLVSTDAKTHWKKYEELWNKIRDFARPATNQKQICSDDNLPLKKTQELCSMVIVVRSVFHESKKILAATQIILCINYEYS